MQTNSSRPRDLSSCFIGMSKAREPKEQRGGLAITDAPNVTLTQALEGFLPALKDGVSAWGCDERRDF